MYDRLLVAVDHSEVSPRVIAAANSAYAIIVAHNYRVGSAQR